MQYLRQSTATVIQVGPFVDDTDGKTLEEGLTVANIDVQLIQPLDTAAVPPDLVTNGDMGSNGSWTENSWSISAGVANSTGAQDTNLDQTLAIIENVAYEVVFEVKARSAGSVTPILGTTPGTARSSASIFTETIIAGSGSLIRFDAIGFTGTIDDVVIKQVPIPITPAASGSTNDMVLSQSNTGMYGLELTAAQLGIVGRHKLTAFISGALVVFHEFTILPQAVYDAMYASGAAGPLQSTTAGRKLDVTANGEAGLDLGNVTGTLGNANVGWVDGNDRIDVGQVLGTAQTAGDLASLISGLNNLSAAAVNAEVDTALTDIKLDHLVAAADGDDPVNGSIMAHLVSATEDWSTFDPSTDSLQAVRDRGDAAWTTGAGGTPPDLLQSTTIATLASQVSFTLTAGSTDSLAYKGAMAVVTDQATAVQKAVGLVSAYDGSTKTITLDVDPGVFTMATGDSIDIIAMPKQLPDAVADSAGGLPISDTGGLDLDAKLANTNEVTAVRMAALTDWIDGNRLDLLLDAIPTTAMRGTDNSALASVVGAIDDAASAGDPTASDTLVQYIKQLINVLVGTVGVGTFPAEQAPANAINLAEVIRAIHADVTGLNGDAMRGTNSANTTTPPTAAANADAVLDEALSDHVVAGSLGKAVADTETDAAATLVDTNELQTDNLPGLIAALNNLAGSDILTTALTEAYAADGVAPTLSELMYMIWSAIQEFGISGTTLSSKKLDSTEAMTWTLDDAADPTSRTRAT